MRILFDAAGHWTPETLQGGSEECVVQLAAALAERGHEVAVCNGCGEATGNFAGVEYLDGEPEENDDPALVIVWRDYSKVATNRLRFPGATIALWCHDIPVPPHFPSDAAERALMLAAADKVVLLNGYHRRIYGDAGLPPDKAATIRIGINRADFEAAKREGILRDFHRCAFISHPGRGLHLLRDVWPKIRAAVPTATLAAFWWESRHFWEPVPELGIEPMRALKPNEVPRELLRCGLLTYPCCFAPEISPASVIKAQVAGCVPIVIPQGGLCDVLHYGRTAGTIAEFTGAVIAALKDPEWQERVRTVMCSDVSAIYRWERAAEEFEALAA